MDPRTTAESTIKQMEDAWNAGDGAAYAAPFAPGADFVNVRGELHTGPAIAAGHQAIFDTIYAGSTVRYSLIQARELDHGVVVAHVSATLDVPAGPLAGRIPALATIVLVPTDDGHRITAFHNTQVAA